jgi:peptidoglycan/LPS O-acetylase OafA/YrhL
VSEAPRSEDRNLDVLRAIAVLFVFVGHLFDFWFGGAAVLGDWLHGMTRMGVILFFVHTSLVLMRSLERLAPGNPHFMREFYIRRIFRIYPLAICSIVVALVFRIPWRYGMTAWVAVPSAKQVISNLLLIQNLTHQESIISPLWSLPLEVQMYVVLPFLFILFSSRVRWISYMVAAWGLSLVAALSMAFLTGHMNLLTYIPCFLSGVVAYRCRFAQRRWSFLLWPCLIIVSSLLASACFQMDREVLNLVWEWPVALLLGLTWHTFHEVGSAAVTKTAHWIAKYSFGIYLWHHIIMFIVFNRLPIGSGVVRALIVAAGTAAASMVSFHLIEDPLISAGKRVAAFSKRVRTRSDSRRPGSPMRIPVQV